MAQYYGAIGAKRKKIMIKHLTVTFLLAFFAFYNCSSTSAAQNAMPASADASFVQTTPYDAESLRASIDNILSQYLPGARLLDFKEVNSNGITLYNCKVSYKNTVTSLVIDPKTGKVRGNFGREDRAQDAPNMAVNSAAVRVSTKQVNNILKQTLPGASVTRTHYNKKDGVIEGFVNYQSFRYYFKINAQTGEIITMQPVGGN